MTDTPSSPPLHSGRPEPLGAEFAGQTVAVVGAGSGIGAATAALLADRGARVACVDLDGPAAARTAAALPRALALTADVTAPDTVDAAFDAAVQAGGRLHAVVNCAGVQGDVGLPSHEVDLGRFESAVRTNLLGALVVTRAAVIRMLPHGYGRIAHVASIAGKEGNPNMVAYSASKAGVIGMVKAQGKEYARTGITVNALAPAVIRTPFLDSQPEEVVRYMTEKIPMGRTGTLPEAASMLAFMVSSACAFTTGFCFDLSGGRATH